MIKKISVESFKCFKETQDFNCRSINLFSGINGRGKSTALQALLLLSQSLHNSKAWQYIYLMGEHINLGYYKDIKNSYSPSGQYVRISLSVDGIEDFHIIFADDVENSNKVAVFNCEEIISCLSASVRKNEIETLLEQIHYVSADRLGPRLYLEKCSLPDFINVGKHGERTLDVLGYAIQEGLTVHDNMYIGSDSKLLLHQTMAWMAYILDGAKLDVKGRDSDSSVLSLLINNREGGYLYKPVNIGFGYSYVLPLIVSGLLAKPGEILIAENPEAHLHPRAQARIAEFYSRIASTGVQVFIESHSEHILNGIRLSCVGDSKIINNDEVSLFFFDEGFRVSELNIDEKGKINHWPKGFFDQKEDDIAKLYRLAYGFKDE